ncbi:hypothetical protein FRB90_011088 [Tulasnella sp. 427]|nr:hypothetical protein FRB90_011088 [Tulasnella sp. 427]
MQGLSQKASNSSDSDEQTLLFILRNIILPRIQRALGNAGCNQPWAILSYDTERLSERTVAHIELMVALICNRDRLTPELYASLVKWQLDAHRRYAQSLLQDYKEATRDFPDDDDVKSFVSALEKAISRAQTLREPDPEKAQYYDVFSIRNIYDDPDIKALVASDRFTPEKRLKLQETVTNLLLQQPVFPPECYIR